MEKIKSFILNEKVKSTMNFAVWLFMAMIILTGNLFIVIMAGFVILFMVSGVLRDRWEGKAKTKGNR